MSPFFIFDGSVVPEYTTGRPFQSAFSVDVTNCLLSVSVTLSAETVVGGV